MPPTPAFVTLRSATTAVNTAFWSAGTSEVLDDRVTRGHVLCIAPPTSTTCQWDNATAAVIALLSRRGVTIQPQTVTLVTPGATGTNAVLYIGATDVIMELLNTAHALGTAPTATAPAFNTSAHVVLGLRTDPGEVAIPNEQAWGSFKATLKEVSQHGTFVIHTAKAKSITITVTIGGVKVTITIRW